MVKKEEKEEEEEKKEKVANNRLKFISIYLQCYFNSVKNDYI